MLAKEESIKETFSGAEQGLIDILEHMLEFNPYFRPTARELLTNKIFDAIRVKNIEEPSTKKIIIDIDHNKLAR